MNNNTTQSPLDQLVALVAASVLASVNEQLAALQTEIRELSAAASQSEAQLLNRLQDSERAIGDLREGASLITPHLEDAVAKAVAPFADKLDALTSRVEELEDRGDNEDLLNSSEFTSAVEDIVSNIDFTVSVR